IYINHSCSPNCGLRGEITFVAMRDINADEEITFDYAFLDNEDYQFQCSCGSLNCRKVITGFDWKIKELQNEYKEYFAEYLKEKM
ncbi:MAG: SET domain-containing protein-lysine N-methyltransferase, partial [Acetatifactor sp.]|nr:SET domain-containing protein-lysine N-methyltransferase [Acetatifactor sp.]